MSKFESVWYTRNFENIRFQITPAPSPRGLSLRRFSTLNGKTAIFGVNGLKANIDGLKANILKANLKAEKLKANIDGLKPKIRKKSFH